MLNSIKKTINKYKKHTKKQNMKAVQDIEQAKKEQEVELNKEECRCECEDQDSVDIRIESINENVLEEIIENKNFIHLTLDVSGISASHLRVQLARRGKILNITGRQCGKAISHPSPPMSSVNGKYYPQTQEQIFKRSISLDRFSPRDVKNHAIRAYLTHGTLMVSIPKRNNEQRVIQ